MTKLTTIPDDIKFDIACVVNVFEFPLMSGTCLARAYIGRAVLAACGLDARLQVGAMLYRAGPDEYLDTLRYANDKKNEGGYHQGQFVGHVWLRLYDEIVDFSCIDWVKETDPALPAINWTVAPPYFIWGPAKFLKGKPYGVPPMGGTWYGPWGERTPYDFQEDTFAELVDRYRPVIDEMVADARIKERQAFAEFEIAA